MFTSVSKAGLGMYITVIVSLLHALGVDLDEGTLTEAVMLVLEGVGALLWIIGQLTRKDLSWGIFRKQ